MISTIIGLLTLLLSTVTFTGEDEGEMLYSIEVENIRHDYVTEKELAVYVTTGVIRNQVLNFKNYEKPNTIMLSNVQFECPSAEK